MAEPIKLDFAVLPATPGKLEIKIINSGTAAATDQLKIDIYLPVDLVDPRIRAAALEAPKKPENIATLAGVVTVAGKDLSVWAFSHPSDEVVDIRISNNLDQTKGTALAAPVKIEAGAAFNVSIPITSQASRAQITIPYEYKYGTKRGNPVTGSLEFTPAGDDSWKPTVSFTTDPVNSNMLKPGEKVTVSWAISDGVSATLRGPLPGGHSELTLSKASSSHFKIDKGSLETYAVGPAIYILDAEVRGPKNKNVQVVRTLLLDTESTDHYASLRVRPDRILPNGEFDILWAVWGVSEVVLRIEGDKSLELTLTERDLSGFYHGCGTWRVQVPKNAQPGVAQRETATLAAITDSPLDAKHRDIFVETWKETGKVTYTGKPLGMAVSAPHMALLTTDGLWIAKVGNVDNGSSTPSFSKAAAAGQPTAWHALAAYEKGFIILRQTAEKGRMDGLQLVYYKSDGQSQEKPPIDLPEYVGLLIRKPGAVFDVAALNKRVYVVVELPQHGGSLRAAYSVSFDSSADWENEPLIERLTNYRLLVFAGALYALNRDSGHLVRFILPESRDIEEASRAATAAKNGPSPTRTGLLVPIDGLLTVLGLDKPPSVKALALSEMTNVVDFSLKSENAEEVLEATFQDLVYNPQKDEWAVCGQGLKIKPGAVAAFRGGNSKRLWVLQPDGKMYTLTGASNDLFTPGYISKFPSKGLLPALNAKRKLTIRNNSGINFITMDNIHGYDKFSSDALVEIDKPPFRLANGARETCQISYHRGDPTPVKLRYLLKLGSGPEFYYFLEMTLSGPDLSSISSVFKRLGEDRAGVVSIHEIPGSLMQHAADSEIVIAPPKRLKDHARLIISNGSRLDTLILSNRQATFNNFQDMTIAPDTRPFEIDILPTGSRRGELRVDINFALADGISYTNSGALKLIHINSENGAGLEVKLAKVLKPGDPPLEVSHRNGKTTFASDAEANTYICQIG